MHDVGLQVATAVKDTPKVFTDEANLIYGIVIGFLVTVFGEHWILFAGFFFLNVADWMTGTYKARIKHESSSEAGAAGAVKKVWQWLVIAIAFYISRAFIDVAGAVGIRLDFAGAFGWLTLAMYLVNEIRSILENLTEIGVDVPKFLIAGLDVTKKLMDAKVDGAIPKEEEKKESE